MEAENEKFTLKQQRFIDEYMIDFNGRRAARDAGFSEKSASEIAYEYLRKPHIQKEIQKRLTESNLGPEATKKMITDIATSNISKYLKKTTTEHTPRVKKSLADIIEDLKREMSFEEEFAVMADFTEKEFEKHTKQQAVRRRQLIRYQLELKRNPKAYRIVYGETKLVETMELDLVALANDKEKGKVKSFSYDKFGRPQVELYAADGALRDVAKFHGLYEKDNNQQSIKIVVNGGKKPKPQEED